MMRIYIFSNFGGGQTAGRRLLRLSSRSVPLQVTAAIDLFTTQDTGLCTLMLMVQLVQANPNRPTIDWLSYDQSKYHHFCLKTARCWNVGTG
jgi:hypothetical protein